MGKKKVMHGQYIRSIDRQLISEEDTFLWLHKTKRYKQDIMQQKYCTRKPTANADYANNLMIK
jgi:hypothetical protein